MSNCTENRKYFFLAVNTGYVTHGLPDQRCYDFYVARSGYGLYCAIVGNVVIPGGSGSNKVCAQISNSDAWHRLAMGISEQGALPGIQLSSAWNGYQGMKSFVASSGGEPLLEYRRIAASLSRDDIISAFDALNRGTEIAIRAGFRHIQLHAAHGYMFNLMIDPRLSPHFELALRLIEKWANSFVSAETETSLRFSLCSGEPRFDQCNQDEFVDLISSLPVCYIDVSAGYYNINKLLIYPISRDMIFSRHISTLKLAAEYPQKQYIMSGKAACFPSELLPPNIHLGICRDLIANPSFLQTRSSGCTDCMKCHYFSRGQSHITCGCWMNTEE